jgi:FtsH-binding integral membrane protein
MERIRAADLLAGSVGMVMFLDFALMDAPLAVTLSGSAVGLFAAISSLYNYRKEVKGEHGLELLSGLNILVGVWLLLLVMFWTIEALKELIAVTGAMFITMSSTYASYYRQEREGRNPDYGKIKDQRG